MDDRAQPLAGTSPVADPEEQQTLVVLVEAGQHVALDVGQVDTGVVGRLRLVAGVSVPPGAIGWPDVEAAPPDAERPEGRARTSGSEHRTSTHTPE